VIAGILTLIYLRSISDFLASFFAKRFRESYGEYATKAGWDNPNSTRNKYFYRAQLYFLLFFY
jgi:hypothetical protein